MKIIIFNAPPSAGKDEAVKHLVDVYGIPSFSFKRRLKAITLAVYNVKESLWDSWYTSIGKELPRPELDGLSCRQALIKISEEMIKPVFGKSFFGEQEAKDLKKVEGFVASCSDGGFNEEIEPLIDAFGKENVYIVQIHREGCSFKNDSRSWVDTTSIPDENYISIWNDHTLEDFQEEVRDIFNYIVGV